MRIVFILILLVFFSACAVIPKGQMNNSKSQKINVGLGPEDMVLDTLSSSNPCLLVACDSRRVKMTNGWIYKVDLKTYDTSQIKRINEPANLVFHPHGIDLVRLKNGDLRILIVSHDDANKQQAILQYRWNGQELWFEKEWKDPILVSPNDVCGDQEGRIFVGNEFKKRGSILSPILGLKNGNVICFENGKASIVARKFCYTNGLSTNEKQFFVAATRSPHIYSFEKNGNQLTKRTKLCKVKGADNLFLSGNNLYVACHLRNFAFIKHVKNAAQTSPTVIYKIDISTGKKTCVYSNTNGTINGASTAIEYNGKLYLCQVFEPFIIEITK